MAVSTAPGAGIAADAVPNTSSPSWAILIRYIRPHRAVLLTSLLISLVSSAAGLALPLATQDVLNSVGSGNGLVAGTARLAALLACATALTGLNSWLQQRTSERVVRQVRQAAVYRLIRMRISELDHRPVGDLTARVTSDSVLVQSAVTDGFIMVINGVVTLVGAIVLMSTLHAGLLATTVGVLLVVLAVLTTVLPRIRLAVTRAQSAVGAIGSALDRTLNAARTVKANGAEVRETELANDAIENAYQAGMLGARYNAVVTMASGASVQFAFLVVLGLGGALVASGALRASALIAFLLYLFYLSSPIGSLINGAGALQHGMGAAARLEEIRSIPIEEDVDVRVSAPESPAPPPYIEVCDVRFAYPDRSPALSGVSFAVGAGSQTAIVGLSGAGKTTLLSLIQRFYEPQQGTISIDGIDIAGLPRGEVRRCIAYVEQDAPLLRGTIRENLLYAAPYASGRDIAEVLADTRLTDFVAALDDGLDTPVGTRGVTLSGGERQRLAIARALLRRPRVLLLDEATAQLDARNEQAMRETVSRAARKCTVILIAHRLSTVTDADQIIVLEHGRVRATGTHAELVRDDSLYRELARTQFLTS